MIEITNNNVLFVDDEELILAKIERKLNKEEFTMFFANSGREALRILKENEIAVIIIDLSMPKVNGIKLLKMINYDYPDLVKVIFSSYSDSQTMISALYSGDVYHYIPKGVVNRDEGYKIEFIPVIKRAIERYNLIKENSRLKQGVIKADLSLEG
ncbi:hypothetical protein U472_01050 [Orenia metallireducens]|uniref:Stage 0 sporulation protein A homolog n=1 Tax=Orenia metallireducens TaxID=1413210 RepID=A0A1C0AD10_9FIRM|nr:response regulator [Orenia metallireducens]OCL28505.1 hypothetical protein U472_01050 [Orenia metallireducens]